MAATGLLTCAHDQAHRLKQVTQGANTYIAHMGVDDRLQQTIEEMALCT